MAPIKKLFVLMTAATPAFAGFIGKIGITTHHKYNPLGEGKDLCENIGYLGPVGDRYQWPMLNDCKKLLSDAEAMNDNEAFRLENVCENNKKDWELHWSFGSCGLFLRPDSTVVVEDKNRIYWMGKQDVVEILRMITTGNNVRDDRVQARGDAYNCLITDLEDYPIGKQYMEFLIDNPAKFEFPFRTPCQDKKVKI